MELTTLDASISHLIVFAAGCAFSIYVFLLGFSVRFRREVNELLSEVFDASMTDEEKMNLGPTVVIPPVVTLILLGCVFVLMNIKALLIPGILLAVATLVTARKRAAEQQRQELVELGRVDL